MTNYTENLAKYIANVQYSDIPAEVIDRAKKLTMHCVGATLAALPSTCVRSAVSTAKDTFGETADLMATAWGEKGKVPMNGAIFVNSTGADTLDWEDCSWTGHPTAGFVPVGMAVAEALKLPGKDYLTAIISGFEVYQRVSGSIQIMDPNFDIVKNGWGLCSWQIWACSMPAGKLLQCNEEQFNLLMGATACETPVIDTIIHKQMSDFYHLQFGFTGINGTMLARMAKRNELDNMYGIFDMEGGYAFMMQRGDNPEWLNRNLGTEYMFNEILFKHWPANMWIQTPLDCLDKMKKDNGFQAQDIESIYITPGFQFRDGYNPNGYRSVKDGQFSIPYCLAAYLLRGETGPGWFDEAHINDPELLDIASRVHLDKEEVLPLRKCFNIFTDGSFPRIEMTITLKDGTVLKDEMQFPKGHPRNPFDWEDAEKTFRIGAKVAGLSAEKTDRFISLCKDLENLDNVAELAECLGV